ncbi:MAG: sppA2 [Candidatus Midichloriaceae bacterium]|jgi:protease-4|nr:sppA2 [Candidatus Midichloriaceae bacterium]
MALTPDQIIDRMNLKKQMLNWRLFAIVVSLLFAFLLISGKDFKSSYSIDGEHIARISIEGPIYDILPRIDNLGKLAGNKNVKGVIIHVNSPGGTAVGGENLYLAIRKIAREKPVSIVMSDMAASAGYMLSLGADHLVAHEATITGSIGVIAQSFEITKLADTLGVKFHNFKSSPLKGGPIPTEHLTPEMQRSMELIIRDTYDFFVGLVSERRNIPLEKLLPLADGRAYTGRQAFSLGLIDALGDEDTAYDWIVSAAKLNASINVKDYDIDPKESRIDRILETYLNISQMIKTALNNNLIYYF